MINTLGLIGKGFVGGALFETFNEFFTVEVFDKEFAKRTVNSLETLARKCEIIFLALPTPIDIKTGIGNFNIVSDNLKILNDLDLHNIVVIKSSLPPGKTQEFQKLFPNLKLVFNPEFLTERNAVQDFKNQDKIILGGDIKHTQIIQSVYRKAFPHANIQLTDTTTAEMVKFTINCFLATKVAFFNEMYQVCQKLNVDFERARELFLLDQRIGESHSQVPGFDGHLGFGGSCFPAILIL